MMTRSDPQKQGQAVLIWAVGAFCIFCWEWLLCLPQEYRQIWKKPLKLPSILYLANRYFGLLQLCFVISLVTDAWSPSACKHVYYWEPVGALISTILSQMILGSRVYAIYGRSKVVGGILAAVLLVEAVFGAYSVSTTSAPPANIPGPPGSSPPCGAVMGPRGWLITFWSIPIFYDALTFVFTGWKALLFWKMEVTTPLFSIIWRDGVLYFFAIFSMNVANIIIFLTVPETLRAVNLTPTLIFEIVLSCRLLLNLKLTQDEGPSNGLGVRPQKLSSKAQSMPSVDRYGASSADKTFIASPYFPERVELSHMGGSTQNV